MIVVRRQTPASDLLRDLTEQFGTPQATGFFPAEIAQRGQQKNHAYGQHHATPQHRRAQRVPRADTPAYVQVADLADQIGAHSQANKGNHEDVIG